MSHLLIGDIGGTKSILCIVETSGDSVTAEDQFEILYEHRFASHDFSDLVPMARQFLSKAEQELGGSITCEKACFAIAGPVTDNTSSLTNLDWQLDGDRLQQALSISHVKLVNDFTATGYGVLGLAASDLHTLQGVEPQPNAPIAVIGAGTGLGECYLTSQSGQYVAYASEGGHANFSPRSEIEFQLYQYLLDKYATDHVSAERVISGQGIVAIYQFLRDTQDHAESPAVGEVVRDWERCEPPCDGISDPAATIAISASENKDPLSARTMQIFVSAYGAEAGDLALKTLSYGGLYIAGGIAAKNVPLLSSQEFMQAFMQKGRVSQLLKKVPVHIILNPKAGLLGAVMLGSQK
jgi:glucokinase